MFAEFSAPYHKATYVGETTEAYETGKDYFIHIQKMLCNRYQVFKSSHHFREHPGHKVYKTLEEIYTKFKINDNQNS